MKVNDMQIGEKICLGSALPPFAENPVDLMWTKVSAENLFLMDGGRNIAICVDAKEPDSPSRNRRTRGCCFFPHTALFQWLNASGKDWYQPSCDTDAEPDYNSEPGFLTEFTEFERSTMLEQEITIATPEGHRKEFGQSVKARCLVSIPSMSQIVPIRADSSFAMYVAEGELFAVMSGDSKPAYAWTRTGMNGSMITTREAGDPIQTDAPRDKFYVFPVIRLKPDAEVESYDKVCLLKSPDGKSANFEMESELEKILFG